jgi:hypothetical protein
MPGRRAYNDRAMSSALATMRNVPSLLRKSVETFLGPIARIS